MAFPYGIAAELLSHEHLEQQFADRLQRGVGQAKLDLAAAVFHIDAELGERAWFAGNTFSAADIQMSFPLEAAAARGGLDGRYKNIQAFLERIHARPGYQHALERGGAYEIAA